MELTQHPKYYTYVQDKETDQRCRQAVTLWKTSGEPIVAETYSLHWTFERARTFVRSFSRLLQEYNRVLWERFPYCRQCGGKCCVANAAHVAAFDSIALTLLGQSLPTLPEEIEATARDCIYRTAKGCVWPVEWRPIECWSFYCTGRNRKTSDSLAERHGMIAEELEYVVFDFLPGALRRYEVVWGDPLVTYLVAPLDFAEALRNALFDIFVAPFNDRYSVIDE